MEARILVVEDNDEVAESIALFLTQEGMQVTRVADGHQAVSRAREGQWDLILLDVMLPGLDGFEICQKLRMDKIDLPILFLTARDEVANQVLGLGLGADDYIVKPFSGLALVARVKANIRRYRELRPGTTRSTVRLGDREIDLSSCSVRRNGAEVQFTAKECELLRFFLAHPGQVFTKDQLFQNVWGERYYESDDNTVMVHIRRLREKIEPDPSHPQFLVTVGRSLGYRLNREPGRS